MTRNDSLLCQGEGMHWFRSRYGSYSVCSYIQISMNVMALSEIHATMEHVKITMDLTNASVYLVMFSI